ncbi:MAG: DUF4337 domain-containing protein [Candidatus Eremiobacteraeota bacterium]|nr:DUF4337 domain-containing protein [Candidatus Eremiobacteraeota bacterium]
MPETPEIETDKLQEQIAEVHEEVAREEAGRWVRYVGLCAAIFAVFAAVSALRAGDLVNEALINQIKASDTWNEYQASRQKEHVYTVALDELRDRGTRSAALLHGYRRQIDKERAKEKPLSVEARRLEEEAGAQVGRHRAFEYAVALLQVAIALGAVAALARSKPAWFVSMASGAVGIIFFIRGFLL